MIVYGGDLVVGCANKPGNKQVGLYLIQNGEEINILKKGVASMAKLCDEFPHLILLRCDASIVMFDLKLKKVFTVVGNMVECPSYQVPAIGVIR